MSGQRVPTDCVLLRASGQAFERRWGDDWIARLQRLYPEAAWMRFARHSQQDLLYGYLGLAHRHHLSDQAWLEWVQRLVPHGFPGLELHRLEVALDLPGASDSLSPRFHYVVETDADEGWQEEIERWYDTEHLKGLASVPGCVRAQRWTNHDGGPRSLACYDLLTEDVLGSPPWMAIRGTPWSSRARPHFRNTRRTMFQRLGPEKPGD